VPLASTQIDELPIPMTSTTPLAGLAELYEHHYETVFRTALRVTGNPADAEDVLQTVFLRVLAREERRQGVPGDREERRQGVPGDREERRQGVPGDREERRRGVPGDRQERREDVEDVRVAAAYFRRAAVNAAVDVLRRRELHAESVYDDLAEHAAVQPRSLLKERLRRAIAALDTEDATLFLLRHVEGLSNEELAAMFQIEKNNVAVRLHRIRHRLQAELER
jgi:RNA polymerase sigma-70 factor, ECF subfamily